MELNRVYIDICDNFKYFLKINNKKLSKKFIRRKLLNFLFLFFLRFNIIQEKTYRRKRIIILYMDKNKSKSLIEKKINKFLIKENNVILSNQILKLVKDSNMPSIQNYIKKTEEDKSNFTKELVNTINFVLNNRKKRIEEINIYILIKQYNSAYNEKIVYMAEKSKSINIITESIKEYKKLEERLINSITNITVTNNKRKSISNAKYIINVDYSEEDLSKYNIYRNATIFNISNNKIFKIRGFEGIIINNIVVIEKDKSFSRIIDRRFPEVYSNKTEIVDIKGNKGSIKNILTK